MRTNTTILAALRDDGELVERTVADPNHDICPGCEGCTATRTPTNIRNGWTCKTCWGTGQVARQTVKVEGGTGRHHAVSRHTSLTRRSKP